MLGADTSSSECLPAMIGLLSDLSRKECNNRGLTPVSAGFLANPGTIPLEIVGVQSGSYLGQDDIVRFEYNYGRKG